MKAYHYTGVFFSERMFLCSLSATIELLSSESTLFNHWCWFDSTPRWKKFKSKEK